MNLLKTTNRLYSLLFNTIFNTVRSINYKISLKENPELLIIYFITFVHNSIINTFGVSNLFKIYLTIKTTSKIYR